MRFNDFLLYAGAISKLNIVDFIPLNRAIFLLQNVPGFGQIGRLCPMPCCAKLITFCIFDFEHICLFATLIIYFILGIYGPIDYSAECCLLPAACCMKPAAAAANFSQHKIILPV